MKIWNKNVEDCLGCEYATSFNGNDLCGYNQNFKDMIPLNPKIFSKELGYFIKPILTNCPFKPVFDLFTNLNK